MKEEDVNYVTKISGAISAKNTADWAKTFEDDSFSYEL